MDGLAAVALLSDGTVKAWGTNLNGELGDGTNLSRLAPTVVPGTFNIVTLDSGPSFTLAVRANGTVVAWGSNVQAQLGDGTQVNRFTAVDVTGLTDVIAVAAGLDHSIALKSDGTVWTWGDNARGQLGDGTLTRRTAPVQVAGLTGIVAIDAGYAASLAIKDDGTVWTWGANDFGQLGDGTTTDRLTPVAMIGIGDAVQAFIRYRQTTVLQSDNTVWTVGDNTEGQLGATGTGRTTVAQVASLPPITSIGAGDVNGYAVTGDGAAWAWGRNGWGNIGDDTTVVRFTPVQIAGPGLAWRPWIPTIGLPSAQYSTDQDVTVTNADPSAAMYYTTNGTDPLETDPVVAAGATVAITQNATLKVRSFKTGAPPSEIAAAIYTFKVARPSFSPVGGAYATSQLVTMSTPTDSASIRYTTDGAPPASHATVYTTPFAVTGSTVVQAYASRDGWASSDIATATYWISPSTESSAPTISPATGTYPTDRVVTITTTEPGSTVRYTVDGTDPTWVSAIYVHPFQVAQTVTIKARTFKVGYVMSAVTAATLTIPKPRLADAPVVTPGGGRFTTERTVTITGPAGATLRYTTTGMDPTETDAVIASGSTMTVDRSLVLKVRAWQSGLAPSVVRREDYLITGAVAAGPSFTMALKTDGTLWTWGYDWDGQLGDGAGGFRTTPFQALTDVVAAAGGASHTLALRADGTVWAWGSNAWGALGDGTGTTRRSPVPVIGLTNVVAIAAADANSYALKADGTVWAWGSNIYGQIGDGTNVGRGTPTRVPGLSGVSAIAAGSGFALALVSDGAHSGHVWAWGRNESGQLGDGTMIHRWTPQPVPGATHVKALVSGYHYDWSGARTVTDELLLWGLNNNGQMSNGTRGGANLFATRVAPWTGPLADAAGGMRTVLALGKDGRLWGWGDNCAGALGAPGCSFWVTGEQIANFTGAAAMTSGNGHTVALARDGQMWCWGSNSSGQCGTGTTTSSSTPAQVPGFAVADNTWLTSDPDSDGLSTWHEYQLGTDPVSADTDGDGIPDGADTVGGPEGTNLDPDRDGLSNAAERTLGTDPYSADSDGDGVGDGVDGYPTDSARSQAPAPDPNDHTPPVITLTYPANARPVGGGSN